MAPDDGETYLQLRKVFNTPQLRIIPPALNKKTGPGATRNRALDVSTGDFFAMLDADDLIPPTYIEELMKVAVIDGAAIAPIRYTQWDESNVIRVPPVHKGHLSLTGFSQLVASLHPLLHRSLETGYCSGFAEDVIHDGLAIARLGTISVIDSIHYTGRLRKGSECNSGDDAEKQIQQAYQQRIEQILKRPSELGMQVLEKEERSDFADLFRFRAFVSAQFSNSKAGCYNTWVAGKEALMWDEFMMNRHPMHS